MSIWANPPPLTILSGENEFLRMRFFNRAVSTVQKMRSVTRISGDDTEMVAEALSVTPSFVVDPSFVVIEDAKKLASTDLLISHHKQGENDTAVLVAFKGSVPTTEPFKKLLAAISDEVHFSFGKSKPWEAEKDAKEFCQTEAKHHGCRISRDVLTPLVKVVGTDYGILSYEVLKLAMYVKSQGRKEITRKDAGKTVTAIFEHRIESLINALKERNGKSALRFLEYIRDTVRDPTILVCGGVGKALMSWIRAKHLMEQGYSIEEAAQRFGMHPYPFEKNFIPITKVWSLDRLLDFLREIAAVQRGAKTGALNPWAQLNALVHQVCTT